MGARRSLDTLPPSPLFALAPPLNQLGWAWLFHALNGKGREGDSYQQASPGAGGHPLLSTLGYEGSL